MRRSRVWSTTLALAAFFGSAWAHGQCTKDVDCKAEQICETGKCADLAPTAAAEASESAATPPATAVAPRVLGPPRVISIESPPVEEPPHFERRSTALMAGGVVATSVGMVAVVIGILSSGSTCYRELSDGFSVEHCERSPNYAAFAIGGLLVAGGIPMIVIGAKKVPVKSDAHVTPWLSPHGGGLTLRLTL
jgi:hypothetical protein